jgi:hypothetical protein
VLKNIRTTLNRTLATPRAYPAAAIALAAAAVTAAPLAAHAATPTSATATAKPAAAQPAAVQPATATAAAVVKPAAAPAPAPRAATPSGPYAGVSLTQLEPTGTVGTQSHITLTPAQWTNATAIVNTAASMHLPPYAATIAVATAMQESKLQNLTVAVDHDSLGLFQQRPSCGWGTPTQLETPTYAATAFLKNLPTGYQNMALHTAAQDVQGSFNGYLYAQWEDQAAHIVSTIANH